DSNGHTLIQAPGRRTGNRARTTSLVAVSGTVIVTDSTASLPPEVAAAHGIRVVPLQVVIGANVLDEGPEGATPEVVAQALRDFVPVSTSRPAPALFAEVYRS